MLARMLLMIILLVCFSPLQAEGDNCLLWELKGEHNSVYLLGSVHMMRSEDYPLDRCVDDALNKADFLVVELNVLAIDLREMALKMRQLGRLPEGQTLKSQIQPETQRMLEAYQDLPVGHQQMRPWMLALTLTLQEVAQAGYRSDLGVDYYLLNKAHGNKPILSLETLDEQLAVLSGDSKAEQDLSLRLTLEQIPELERYVDEVRDAWKRGDALTVYRAIEQPKRDYPQLAEQFYRQVTKRNYNMASQIAGYLKDKEDYLVVIGGGHLGGEEGVLALLQEQGVMMQQQPKLGRSMLY